MRFFDLFKSKNKVLILYSIVCTMVLICTCTNNDTLVELDLREMSGLELPTADCLRIDRLISKKSIKNIYLLIMFSR